VRLLAAAALCLVLRPAAAAAQTSERVWADGTIDWLATERTTYELIVEGRTAPATLNVTPHAEYAVAPWIDVLGEAELSRESGATATVTPRAGAQFHILSRLLATHVRRGADREKLPRRRLVVSTLLRFEHTGSMWQLRDRFDMTYPLNRHKVSDDGAVYVTADNELFIPLDRAPGAALVNQMRARAGFGYRQSFRWRFEMLYVWNGTRHAETAPWLTKSHVLDIRVKREF